MNANRTKINRYLIISFFLFCLQLIVAQTPERTWQWVQQIGGSGNELPTGLVIDSKNNIYLSGIYTRTLNNGETIISNNGSSDFFLTQYTSDGKLKWLWNTGSEGADKITCMTIDNEDRVWFAGEVSSGAKFNKTLVNENGKIFFLASVDKKGNSKLQERIYYTGHANLSLMEIDDEGQIYIAGTFNDTLKVGNEKVVSKGKSDIFILRFASEGTIEKAMSFGGAGSENITGFTTNSQGDVIFCGNYTKDFEIDKQTIKANKTEQETNAFLVTLDKEGLPKWSHEIRSEEFVKLTAIKTDQFDNLYLAGNFNVNLKLTDTSLVTTGQSDIFVGKFNNKSDRLWLKQYGSLYMDYLNSLLLDNLNGIIITGSYTDSIRFGNFDLISEFNKLDAFVAQIDAGGIVKWADNINCKGNNLGKGAVLDKDGHLYLSGIFRETLEAYRNKLESTGRQDIYLARYQNCEYRERIIDSEKESICPDGELVLKVRGSFVNVTWNDTIPDIRQISIYNPGIYHVQCMTDLGCIVYDTIAISESELPQFCLGNDTTLYVTDTKILNAPKGFKQLLWSDLSNGENLEAKAVDNLPGKYNYWLEVTDSLGCSNSDTIFVEFIEHQNWLNLDDQTSIITYPNPVYEDLNWYLETDQEGRLDIRLTDAGGKTVYYEQTGYYIPGNVQEINMKQFDAGLYYLIVGNQEKSITTTIVHE